jgi:hypothetical protein
MDTKNVIGHGADFRTVNITTGESNAIRKWGAVSVYDHREEA